MSHPIVPSIQFVTKEQSLTLEHIPNDYPVDNLFVNDSEATSGKSIPMWNGHQFELMKIQSIDKQNQGHSYLVFMRFEHNKNVLEYRVAYYFGIDPRIKKQDILGAVKAYLNSAKTGWLFSHTEEGTHHDYELSLVSAVEGIFQPYLRQYQVDAILATGEEPKDNARLLFVTLSKFYGSVVNEARRQARKLYLGERHQKPHPRVGYLDSDITNAIATIKTKWLENNSEELDDISRTLGYIDKNLNMPTVETRWQQEARKKKEAELQGGNNG